VNDPKGLLSSVMDDAELLVRLEQMPSDEKTVTICSVKGNKCMHPSWRRSVDDYSASETLDLIAEPSEAPSAKSTKALSPCDDWLS